MINTHQELVLALSEAAELEHSLICQYLFAAYSIKNQADAIAAADVVLFAAWQEKILNVARQEMGHLGTVWNLQALAGAAPYAGRVNFPQPGGRFYPPHIDFSLTPFSDDTLQRFIEFERPEHGEQLMLAGVPDPLDYSRVGDLYRQIRQAVIALPEDALLIDTTAVEDSRSWSNNVTLKTATTRQEVIDAIDFIIQQGEGTPGATAGSHFAIFVTLKDELAAHLNAGGAAPGRDVAPNPWMTDHRDAAGGTPLTAPAAVEAVSAFNLIYGCLLQLLRHYYAKGTETEDQRDNLKMASYRLMHACLGPLGELLTRMTGVTENGLRAGPSFEHFGAEDLAAAPRAVWRVVASRLLDARGSLVALQGAGAGPDFGSVITGLEEALDWLTADQPA